MPIHDQGYRRYGGTRAAVGQAWLVMTRAGVMSVITKRVFIGVMLWAWAPFVVRTVLIYVASNFRSRVPRAQRRDVPRVPGSARPVRVLRHALRGRRPDRQRSSRQRAAAVFVEADDARGIHRRQAGDLVHLPRVGDVSARDGAAADPGDLRRQLHLRAQQPLPLAGHHAVLARAGAGGVDDDARAVVDVEERPLRGGDVRRLVLLYDRTLPGDSRHHRKEQLRVAVTRRLARAAGRCRSSGSRRATRSRPRWPA